MILKNEIENILKQKAKSLGCDDEKVVVSFSNRPELCDFQCNYAMMMAKALGKKPIDLANELIGGLTDESFEFSAVMPGFINIKITDKKLSEVARSVVQDKHLGVSQVENKRKVFFDYGGANVAKELHVGHLRSPIVGEALKRLHIVKGNETISDVHLGDYGLQMGLTILQLKLDGYLDKFFEDGAKIDALEIKNVTLDVLNEEYPKASKRKDVDKEFKSQADEFTLYIQRHKEPYFTIYKKIRELSVKEIENNYDLLNTSFDYYYGESDAYDVIDKTIQIFVDNKLARESEGALVVDVAREGEHIPIPKKSEDEPQRYKNPMPPAIIKKYNGGDLYATTDIATILIRNRDFVPDEIVYITDNRQSTHFEQVFRCCKIAGISPDEQKLTHIGFGTMNGKDGKPFKTRAGGTVKYKDVVNMLVDSASKKLSENGMEKDFELARRIGVGAMKFGDLSNTVEKDYVFDIDKFLAFDGKTGPYIQYTIARINSILSKANVSIGKVDVQTEEEQKIVIAILKLLSAYDVCYEQYSMNGLCLATFDLASAFSTFYNNHKILSCEDVERKSNMLAVCQLVKLSLEKALWTLGIDSVEKM
ncbi:MAG: arginine--tRNA ligase [Clostridia bacterium]|nr:arginine--tRNA ligase [Clostridia bacterium]